MRVVCSIRQFSKSENFTVFLYKAYFMFNTVYNNNVYTISDNIFPLRKYHKYIGSPSCITLSLYIQYFVEQLQYL